MLFSDPEFLFLFLPAVLVCYFLAPRILRNLILVLASLLFYAAGEGAYLLVLLGSIVFNYLMGLAIQGATDGRRRRLMLGIAVGGDLLMLVRFKYLGFMVSNISAVLNLTRLGPIAAHRVHLPIGISFFTFQAISYVIDIYRGVIPAMTNPLHFALYKSFFPQLIAGPVVRAKTVMQEINHRQVRIDDFAEGARRFVVGLGKKLVIADTVAIVADAAFGAPQQYLTTGLAWLGLLCYSLQIYYDFSGYSDMAIGMGRMFGFRFLENFRYPYFAQSVSEFWRRWHISLSTWFRDYLYIPLGGNRVSPGRVYLNLLIVFLLCGLWHGPSWTFVVWGLWHGAFLASERAGLKDWIDSRGRTFRHVYTLLAVTLGWVFFRAATLSSAVIYLLALGGLGSSRILPDVRLGSDLWIAVAIGVVFAAPVVKWIKAGWMRQARSNESFGQTAYLIGRLAGTAVMACNLFVSLLLSAAGTHNPFIYFRF